MFWIYIFSALLETTDTVLYVCAVEQVFCGMCSCFAEGTGSDTWGTIMYHAVVMAAR